MEITVKFKLLLRKEQMNQLEHISKEYINAVNDIVSSMVLAENKLKLTSKNVIANMPSAVKNQAIRDAKSIFSKYKKQIRRNLKKKSDKEIKVPVLKKPVCIWNNQNYSLKDGILSLPIMIHGKSQRIQVKTLITDYQLNNLEYKLGALRITRRSGKWIAQISISIPEPIATGESVMGVDLGLKVPAVAVTDSGKTKFFGNGRMNKYIKRKFRAKRKELGKAKKLNNIRKLDDKEQRWMKDQDHKVSREIVRFAIKNNVSVIQLEQLTNIRNTAKTSRKNEKNLHTWSFYRLAQDIEYKAKLSGIAIEYVNPKHTSQKCPNCNTLNKAKDRKYKCSCGFKTHRDRLDAMNIMNAPVIDGNSLSA
ncbi:transposase [Clostridium formicaceticum]|uniref:Transposase n=1 Tax=Clostridium formicaceticum TaxID=1497 RepID=A0AAC9WHJ6_9CLOT|nr:transposase [Clostridium formicaceticum]ARE89038.1 putative transposase [Clostridium formicaceticum]